MKVCRTCKKEKSLSDFYARARRSRVEINLDCKPCVIKKNNAHPNKKANDRARYARNKDRFKILQMKYRYGLSPEEYLAFVEKRNNACEICGFKQTKSSNALAIDHNHKTGKIRGLLCHLCNRALGLLRADNDLTIVKKAFYYMKATDGNSALERIDL